MKLKHLFFNALAVMAFAACSSEAEEIKPAEKVTTATLELDMTGQYGTGSTDQTRALSLDGTEYPRFIHEEGVTDWNTHCFIRNEAGTVQFYALVDWNATTDADGNISLHIKNSTLTLQNSAGSDVTATETLPKAGERWYIAGIAGGGVLDATKSNVNFAYNETLDADLKPNQARIPITFGWTGFTIPTNTERAPQIVVQFKPQGTLLTMYVNNATNINNVPLNAAMVIESNALSQLGGFDYSLTASRADYSSTPKWTFKDWPQLQRFSRNINIDTNEKSICCIWAMPRPSTEMPSSGFETTARVGGYTYFLEGSSTLKPEKLSKRFESGLAYALNGVDVYRPTLPQDFITEYGLTATGTFANSVSNDALGYFSGIYVDENIRKNPSYSIDGVGYHLPSALELRAILPFWLSNKDIVMFNKATSEVDYEETLQIDGLTSTFTSDYKGTTTGKAYALRYKRPGDISRLTAIRYEYLNNTASTGKMLKITFRHLGVAGASTNIDQIADEAFWQSNTAEDKTFYFPAAGYKNSSNTLLQRGNAGFIWGQRTQDNSLHGWQMSFYGHGAFTGTFPIDNLLPVRLFKNNAE